MATRVGRVASPRVIIAERRPGEAADRAAMYTATGFVPNIPKKVGTPDDSLRV